MILLNDYPPRFVKKYAEMAWIILALAGLFEVAFASSLARAQTAVGSAQYGWYASFVICLMLSMAGLMKAVQTLPVGTAYAVWTGIGAAGTVLVGILFFKEPAGFWRLFFLSTLILSIAGLKMVSK